MDLRNQTDLRKIDALIAEHIMNREYLTHCEGCEEEFDGFVKESDWACSLCDYQYGSDPTCPRYSTDIAASWEVVERLFEQGLEVHVCPYVIGNVYQVEVFQHGCHLKGSYAQHSSAPLAICLAALKAKGVEV